MSGALGSGRWLWLALAWSPQDPSPPRAVDQVVATVEGEAITASELAAFAPGLVDGARRQALRELALKKLIDVRAGAAQIKVDDDRLSAAFKDRVQRCGGRQKYDAFLVAVGRTAEQDRNELRKALAGLEFVRQCLGESPGSKLERPELARRIEPTTKELLECWKENKDAFRIPARLVAVLVKVDASGAAGTTDASGASDVARAEIDALLHGKSPTDVLGAVDAAAERKDAPVVRKLELVESQLDSLREELRAFARDGQPGAFSPPVLAEGAWLALGIVERTPAREPAFEDAHEAVREFVRARRRAEVEQELYRRLVAEASIWPGDLFGP